MPDDRDIPITPPAPGPPPPEEPGHEHGDVNVRGLAYFFAAMAAVGVAIWFFTILDFDWLMGTRPPFGQPSAAERGKAFFQRPPEPRLQVAPSADMEKWRAYEDSQLQSYGWLERGEGVVRIPIDQAMRLTVERLPKPKPEDLERERKAAERPGRAMPSSSGRPVEARQP